MKLATLLLLSVSLIGIHGSVYATEQSPPPVEESLVEKAQKRMQSQKEYADKLIAEPTSVKLIDFSTEVDSELKSHGINPKLNFATFTKSLVKSGGDVNLEEYKALYDPLKRVLKNCEKQRKALLNQRKRA
jgi:hypothetical protein